MMKWMAGSIACGLLTGGLTYTSGQFPLSSSVVAFALGIITTLAVWLLWREPA